MKISTKSSNHNHRIISREYQNRHNYIFGGWKNLLGLKLTYFYLQCWINANMYIKEKIKKKNCKSPKHLLFTKYNEKGFFFHKSVYSLIELLNALAISLRQYFHP